MKSKVVAIYARVSSLKQKEGETIESQINTLVSHAKEKNFQVPEGWIFKDDGYSGASIDRPGLDELRSLIRDGCVDAILVYSPDRLARDFAYQLILEKEFFKYRVDLIYFKGPSEDQTKTAEGRLLVQFQGVFAEYERALILDRSRRGKIYKAKRGDQNILPCPPFGYVKNRGELFYTIDIQEANIIKEIFHLYVKEGYKLQGICTYLEEKGISTPKGNKLWTPRTLKYILENTAYIGTAYYGKSERGEGDPQRIARYAKSGKKFTKAKDPRKERHKDLWEAISVPIIINESTFQEAQVLLCKNKQLSARNTKHISVLQGILVCGLCGKPFYKKMRRTETKECSYYHCRSHVEQESKKCGNKFIPQQYLDNLIWENIIEMLKTPQLIEKEIERRIKDGPEKKNHELLKAEMEREEKKIETSRNKLLDAFQAGDCLSLDELRLRMGNLMKQQERLKMERESLEAEYLKNEKINALSLTLENFRRSIEVNAKELDELKKQTIVRSLVDEIVIFPGEITIKHVIPLAEEENAGQLCVNSAGQRPGYQ